MLHPRVLRAYARVVEPGGARVHGGGRALIVHQADGAHAVDHAVGAQGEGGRVLSEALVKAVPRRLNADQLDGRVVEEGREEA